MADKMFFELNSLEERLNILYHNRDNTTRLNKRSKYIAGLPFAKHVNSFGETYDCCFKAQPDENNINLISIGACLYKLKRNKGIKRIDVNENIFYTMENDNFISLNCISVNDFADYAANTFFKGDF